mgnify:CR=1 FL=1
MALTPEELQEKLNEATDALERLQTAQGSLSETQRSSLESVNEFLTSLNAASTELTEMQIKFEAITKAKEQGSVLDRAEIERFKIRIAEQKKLSEFHLQNQKSVNDLISKSSKLSTQIDQQQQQITQRTGDSAQTLQTNFQRITELGINVAQQGTQVVGDLLNNLVASNNKVGLSVLAFGGGVGKMKEAVSGLVGLPLALDSVDASFNKAIFSQENFASSLISGVSSVAEFESKFPDLAKQLQDQGGLLDKAGLTLKDYEGALKGLTTTSVEFKNVFIPGNRAAAASTTSLFAALQRLGVESADLNGILNTLSVGLDMSAQDSNNFDRELFTLGKTLGIGNAAFKGAAGSLQFLQGQSNDVTTSFKELTIQATAAGTTVLDLATKGSLFNTFDGAAKAVQSVNAALGDQVLDFTELLEAPIEDKFKIIRERLQESGVSFNDLSFQAKKIISTNLGFDNVGQAAMILSDKASALYENFSKGASDAAASNADLTDQVIQSKTAVEKATDPIQSRALAGTAELVKPLQMASEEVNQIINNVYDTVQARNPDALANIIALGAGLSRVLTTGEAIGNFVRRPSFENAQEAALQTGATGLLSSEMVQNFANDNNIAGNVMGTLSEGTEGIPVLGTIMSLVADHFNSPTPNDLTEKKAEVANLQAPAAQASDQKIELAAEINLQIDDKTIQTLRTKMTPDIISDVNNNQDRKSKGQPSFP